MQLFLDSVPVRCWQTTVDGNHFTHYKSIHMKKKTTPQKKTVNIPVKLADKILGDLESLQRELFKKPFGVREATLASAHELAEILGYETPAPGLNDLLRRDRQKLRKAYAGTDMTDVEMGIDVVQSLWEEEHGKKRRSKTTKK
jgi:hypothetical protein